MRGTQAGHTVATATTLGPNGQLHILELYTWMAAGLSTSALGRGSPSTQIKVEGDDSSTSSLKSTLV